MQGPDAGLPAPEIAQALPSGGVKAWQPTVEEAIALKQGEQETLCIPRCLTAIKSAPPAREVMSVLGLVVLTCHSRERLVRGCRACCLLHWTSPLVALPRRPRPPPPPVAGCAHCAWRRGAHRRSPCVIGPATPWPVHCAAACGCLALS